MKFELSCFVEAPRDVVFGFLEHAEASPRERWSLVPGVRESSPPVRLWIPVPGPTEIVLLACEPPERLVYRWTMGNGVRGEVDYRLEPADDGTHVEQRLTLRTEGPLRALAALGRGALHAAAERRLRRIQRQLEGRAHHESRPLSWPPDPPRVHGVERRSVDARGADDPHDESGR